MKDDVRHDRGGNRLVAAGALVFAVVWLFRLVLVWSVSPEHLVSITPDDAYYYFAIAHNTALGIGSTFDGVNLTNGYHPLWLMICAGVALVMGMHDTGLAERILLARTMLTVELAVGALAVLLGSLALAGRLRAKRAAALFAAGCAVPFVVYGMTDGMESGLVILFLAALLHSCLRFDPLRTEPTEKDAALGALLAMGLMARLDLALLIVSFGVVTLVLWWTELMREESRGFRWIASKAALWSLPVLMMLALYLMVNHLHFDTLTPISGQLKNKFPRLSVNVRMLRGYAIPIGFGVYTVVAAGVYAMRRGEASGVRLFLGTGALFVTLHLASTILFTNWAVHLWHFTSYWIIGGMATALWAERWVTSSRTWALVGVLAAVAGAGQWYFLRGRASTAFQTQSFIAAQAIKEKVPEDKLIGMTDCGVFGYIRGGHVVNLDGVVNNRAYQDSLHTEGLTLYLDERGIDYVAHHAVPAGGVEKGYDVYTYGVRSHLYDEPGGDVSLEEKYEVYRGPVYDDGTGRKRFMIWKVPPRRGRHPWRSAETPPGG